MSFGVFLKSPHHVSATDEKTVDSRVGNRSLNWISAFGQRSIERLKQLPVFENLARLFEEVIDPAQSVADASEIPSLRDSDSASFSSNPVNIPSQPEIDGVDVSQISFPVDETLRTSSLKEAVEKIEKGEKPFMFVDILNENEKDFLDEITQTELIAALNELDIRCLGGKNSQVGQLNRENIEKATEILSRIIQSLDEHQIRFLKLAMAMKSPNWHTDGCWNLSSSTPSGIRMTIAFKGNTTRFFYPTESEFKNFQEMNMSFETVMEEVTKITSANPERSIMGKRYDICIFHNATIHQGDISPLFEERVLLTMSGADTGPIAFQSRPTADS